MEQTTMETTPIKTQFPMIVYNKTLDDINFAIQQTSSVTVTDDIHDTTNYLVIKEAKTSMQKMRTAITKHWLSLREETNQYNKDILAHEKELLAPILEEETRLKNCLDFIDIELEKEKRKVVIPMRQELCKSKWIIVDDDTLLLFDKTSFDQFVIDKEKEILEAAQAKLLADQQALERAQELKKAADDAAALATAKAEQDARDNQLKEAEAKKNKRIAQVQSLWMTWDENIWCFILDDKFIAKQDVLDDDDETFARKIIDIENHIKEKKIQADIEAKAQQDKEDMRYQDWLMSNWYSKDNTDYSITEANWKRILWKKVGEYE